MEVRDSCRSHRSGVGVGPPHQQGSQVHRAGCGPQAGRFRRLKFPPQTPLAPLKQPPIFPHTISHDTELPNAQTSSHPTIGEWRGRPANRTPVTAAGKEAIPGLMQPGLHCSSGQGLDELERVPQTSRSHDPRGEPLQCRVASSLSSTVVQAPFVPSCPSPWLQG